jgi:hypothetical protein
VIRRALIAVTCLGLAVAVLGGCGASNSHSAVTEPAYGSLPTYLPSSALKPDSVLTGSAGHPALTVEGDAVLVGLPAGVVRAVVSGPVVPGEGLPFQPPATTATWTVTLSDSTADIPIVVTDFTTIDHLGASFTLALVPGEAAPPDLLRAGQTATFELRAVMPTGEGVMRWAPGGSQIVASWDFVVEND